MWWRSVAPAARPWWVTQGTAHARGWDPCNYGSSQNRSRERVTRHWRASHGRAEDLGFDAFFRSDHFLKMGDVGGLPGPTDAWITLAGLALQTSRIRLGTLMTAATFRLPGPLAVAVAQVDQMSGGRVEFGLGAAWYAAEHAAYGIPFPGLGERFTRLRGATRDHHRPVGDPSGQDILLRGSALPADRFPCPAQTRAAAAPACAHRRRGPAHGRRGSPRGSPMSTTSGSAVSRTRQPRSAAFVTPAPRWQGTRRRSRIRWRRWCARGATRPSSRGAPMRSAGIRANCGRPGSRARQPRSWPRSATSRRSAPNGSTCRCST